jgi:hypothetical protein
MAHLKIVNTSRGHIHEYENTTRKLYNCNANIYFNRQCLQKKLIPNYANEDGLKQRPKYVVSLNKKTRN